MNAIALEPEQVTAERIAGHVLCTDIVGVGASGRTHLHKGHVLAAQDADILRTYGAEIHLLQLDSGDVHEDVASGRLARAIAGDGLKMSGPVESQTNLRATFRGLLEVNAAVVRKINLLPDMSVYTLYDGQPVLQGKKVAAAKVTPLAVPEGVLSEAERTAAAGFPVVRVRPFLQQPVGVVVRDRLRDRPRQRFEEALHRKIGWFSSPLAGIRYVPDDVDAIVLAINELLREGVCLLLAAGVNSTDPLDLTVQAVQRVGAHAEKRGVPAHPGSTCWLASIGDVPVFGLALCGMFSRTTVLDLLLPRFLSGRPVHAEDLAALGHGGMLGKEMAFRFPAYEAVDQSEDRGNASK
ncbi:MAG: molybdopterin-binding protein [Chloroflexota bacterium]